VIILEGGNAPEEYRLGLIIHSWLFEIFECCICIVAPQVFELVDLGVGDLTGTQLLCFTWWFDEPREERSVVYERRPKSWVPGCVF
jgi:hypothetical protein